MTASVHPAHRAVQISNRNLLIFVLAAFAVLAALVALSSGPYWLQRLSGPQTLDLAGLTALTEAELPRYSVAVTGEELLDTGYEEYTTENGRRTSTDAYYGALVLGERLLIVRHPQVIQENFTSLQGALMMPSGIPAEIIAEIIKEVPEVEAALLPWVLDVVDSSRDWVLGLNNLSERWQCSSIPRVIGYSASSPRSPSCWWPSSVSSSGCAAAIPPIIP